MPRTAIELPGKGTIDSVSKRDSTSALRHPTSYDDDDIILQHMDLPSITAGAEDWAFQEVDMAFFDSLLRGVSCPEAAGLTQQMS
nr:dehydrocurvularin biosynthesis regulator [Quercus suber]